MLFVLDIRCSFHFLLLFRQSSPQPAAIFNHILYALEVREAVYSGRSQLPEDIYACQIHDLIAISTENCFEDETAEALHLFRTDKGHDYHGTDEMKPRKSTTNAHGQLTVEVLHVAEIGNETVATSKVSGRFLRRSFVK